MFRSDFIYSYLLAITFAVGMSGCGSTAQQAQKSPSKNKNGDQQSKQSKDQTVNNKKQKTELNEIEVALSKLSAADRTLAEAQKICPVSGKLLGSGSMGTPIKLKVKGQDVFICCEGCEDSLLEEPDKYLPNIKK